MPRMMVRSEVTGEGLSRDADGNGHLPVSDIEGSTRLVQTLGDDYPELLDQPSVCCEGLSQKVEVSSAALI